MFLFLSTSANTKNHGAQLASFRIIQQRARVSDVSRPTLQSCPGSQQRELAGGQNEKNMGHYLENHVVKKVVHLKWIYRCSEPSVGPMWGVFNVGGDDSTPKLEINL